MTHPEVFVDSWAWVAMAIRRDPAHAQAVARRRACEVAGQRLVSSSMVIAESLTRLRYDQGWAAAITLVDGLAVWVRSGELVLVHDDPRLWQDAVAWFRRFDDQRFSMVDCTSFAIMAARGIGEALTADHHFATAGFVPLGAA
ncbi:MAG: PIN domain-containing protein [Fimbriimonadaceae bacterium]|nr:PIN domain-containing protein [Fimbriimonadaceae bacterium]